MLLNRTKTLLSLALSASTLTLTSPALAQRTLETQNYRYAPLDMQRICLHYFETGKTWGNRSLLGGWHSPGASSGLAHYRCKYRYAMTYSTQIGGQVMIGGGVNGEVGQVNGGLQGNGSRTDNESEVREGVVTGFSWGELCKQQQGTDKFFWINGYLYCQHRK